MSINLKAIKALKYRTRRLLPDDDFRVKNEREARVLVALGKAVRNDNPNRRVALDDARAKVGMEPISRDSEEIKALRDSYAERFGSRPFMGWSAEQLKEKLAKRANPTVVDTKPELVPVEESPVTVTVVEKSTQRKPRKAAAKK